MTAKDVAKMLRTARLVYRVNEGTMTKPPPTPNRPLSTPDTAPVPASAQAQGMVQIRRPSLGLRTQGICGAACSAGAPLPL